MNFEFDKSGDLGILTFEGELINIYKEDIRSVLMISLSNVNHVVLNFDNVTNIDSDCLQCLCHIIKTSRKLKKTLTMTGNHLEGISRKVLDNCLMGICSECAVYCAHTI